MFKFGMDIPKGATTVTLPDHADIVLFAATLVNEKYPAVTPASELFRTALKADNGEEATTKTNLLKQAKLIKCSGETNEKEVARYAVDGDVKTNGVIQARLPTTLTSTSERNRRSVDGSW